MSSPRHGRLDAGLETLLRVGGRMRPLDPVALGLAAHRRAAAEAIAARLRPFVEALGAAVSRRDPDAVERYDLLAAYALRELRASPAPGAGGLLSAIDRMVKSDDRGLQGERTEPRGERAHALDVRDRFNEHLGSYARWLALLEKDLEGERQRPPVRVHAIAARSGGFALALKARHGRRVRVVASDPAAECLDLGRADASERGLEVEFVRLDASDISALALDRPDLVLCTERLHRFSPGLLGRVLGEAARATRRAVCFIDAERGALPLALLTPLLAAYGRSWAVAHDTFVALRRMYVAEELLLLAALAPHPPSGARVTAGRFGPGHAFVRIDID